MPTRLDTAPMQNCSRAQTILGRARTVLKPVATDDDDDNGDDDGSSGEGDYDVNNDIDRNDERR